MGTAKALVFLALCVLFPALAIAEYIPKFNVVGRVYCDTCRAGFETDATPGIAGAKVKIQCKERDNLGVKYTAEGTTDSTGSYSISVVGDRGDNLCDVELVSSPQSECSEPDPGRKCSRVILTNNNGLISETRYANALGFFRSEPMSGCTQILKKYKASDE